MRIVTLISGNLSNWFKALRKPLPKRGEPGVGWMSNGGRDEYQLRWKTTSGFMAVRFGSGRVRVFVADGEGPPIRISGSRSLTFWSCAGGTNKQPSGQVLMLGCPDSELSKLDVIQLHALEELDCPHNRLCELDLTGLTHLQSVRSEGNPFLTPGCE